MAAKEPGRGSRHTRRVQGASHRRSPLVAGAYTTPDQHTPEHKAALKISDELSEELLSATELLIATTMWNLTLPAALTSYMDQVIRFGKTFSATYDRPCGWPASVHSRCQRKQLCAKRAYGETEPV